MPEIRPQPLTPKEKNLLEYLEGYISHHGLSPTFQEIKDHFGFASFNSVQRYLKQLEQKNYLHVPGGNRKRAISLLHSSSAVQSSAAQMNPGASKSFAHRDHDTPEAFALPLLGRVAAGQPIEAFDDNEFVDVPASFVRNPQKSYALRVEGQSMIEDGIHDGDIVLVQEQKHASQGEIVVAVVEGSATVKRFYRGQQTSDKIELRPANSQMQSMWFMPQEVEIRGVVVGLMRKY